MIVCVFQMPSVSAAHRILCVNKIAVDLKNNVAASSLSMTSQSTATAIITTNSSFSLNLVDVEAQSLAIVKEACDCEWQCCVLPLRNRLSATSVLFMSTKHFEASQVSPHKNLCACLYTYSQRQIEQFQVFSQKEYNNLFRVLLNSIRDATSCRKRFSVP